MSEKFYKVAIDSPYPVIKGFVQGFIQGRGHAFDYYFLKRGGDKRGALSDAFKDYLSLHCHSLLCLPESVLEAFERAIQGAMDTLGAHIESIERIESASFRFSFHLYSETYANCCKDVLKKLPAGVKLERYAPVESVHDGITQMHDTIYEFAPIASYTYEGGGLLTGDFAGILQMYRKIKTCPISGDVMCGDLRVEVAEKEPVAV